MRSDLPLPVIGSGGAERSGPAECGLPLVLAVGPYGRLPLRGEELRRAVAMGDVRSSSLNLEVYART